MFFVRKSTLVLLIIIASLFLSACATPQGCDPTIPEDQIAVLDGYNFYSLGFVGCCLAKVESVDGKRCNLWSAYAPYKLEPGLHHAVAFYPRLAEIYRQEIPFTVEPGHRYQIRGHEQDGVIRLWIEDLDTKTVAGMATTIKQQ
jgi:hypothetical protein